MQPNANPRRLVVDASIAAKWYLDDEEYSDEARMVLEDFGANRIALVAPAHLYIETANAIRNALRSQRLAPDAGRASLTSLIALSIPAIALSELLLPGFEAALRYGCALYDGLYLALAEHIESPLVHADRRLHHTLAGRFPYELWIGDYVN